MVSSIQAELERQAAIDKAKVKGPVAQIASEYVFSNSDRLLGLVGSGAV